MEQQLKQLILDLNNTTVKTNKDGYHYRYVQGLVGNVVVLLRDNFFSGSRSYYMVDLDAGVNAVTEDPRAALAFLKRSNPQSDCQTTQQGAK